MRLYDLISNVEWNIPAPLMSQASLHPFHRCEPDKFALVSTPISILFSLLGPFDRDDGFVDITNLGLYESHTGASIVVVSQEGWPGFDGGYFFANVITGEEPELLVLDSAFITPCVQEQETGTLDIQQASGITEESNMEAEAALLVTLST